MNTNNQKTKILQDLRKYEIWMWFLKIAPCDYLFGACENQQRMLLNVLHPNTPLILMDISENLGTS